MFVTRIKLHHTSQKQENLRDDQILIWFVELATFFLEYCGHWILPLLWLSTDGPYLQITHTDDMENEIEELLQEFEEKSGKTFLHTVCFYWRKPGFCKLKKQMYRPDIQAIKHTHTSCQPHMFMFAAIQCNRLCTVKHSNSFRSRPVAAVEHVAGACEDHGPAAPVLPWWLGLSVGLRLEWIRLSPLNQHLLFNLSIHLEFIKAGFSFFSLISQWFM